MFGPSLFNGMTRQMVRKTARRAAKARTRESLPFSGVFQHGEPVNPPHGTVRGMTVVVSPIVALMLAQAAGRI